MEFPAHSETHPDARNQAAYWGDSDTTWEDESNGDFVSLTWSRINVEDMTNKARSPR
jgi:hypothetical protein